MLRDCAFTQWFNMQINLFSYPSMSTISLEIRENSKKNYGDIPKILIISLLPVSLDYQTWYQTDTKINPFTQWFNMQVISLKYLWLLIKT